MHVSPPGAPLVLPDQPSVVLTTSGMSMSLSSVISAKAEELTDQQWDANLGLEENEQPEVPPDGGYVGPAHTSGHVMCCLL